MKYYVGHIPDSYKGDSSKFKIKDRKIDGWRREAAFDTIQAAEAFRKEIIAKYPKCNTRFSYSMPNYLILTTDELRAQWNKCQNISKKNGLEKRKVTLAKRKALGIVKKPEFVLCPTCNAKSKKLFSEMGGLQTRICQNGHKFGYDTFAGSNRYTKTYDQFCDNKLIGSR